MQNKNVILLFEGFDDANRATQLRRLYQKILPMFIANLQPQLLEAAETVYGEFGAPEVTEAILDLPITLASPFTILTANLGLSCQPRFGWYDPARDAVMMWLEHQNATDERPTTLAALFDRPPSIPVGIRYYLVFSLSDIRIGSVVDIEKGKVTNGQPEYLSVPEREEIFAAAGYPKLS